MGAPAIIKSVTLRTAGVGESQIDERIADLMTSANPTVGLAAHAGQTDVRVTAKAASEAEADALLEGMVAQVEARLGTWIYGTETELLEEVVDRGQVPIGVPDRHLHLAEPILRSEQLATEVLTPDEDLPSPPKQVADKELRRLSLLLQVQASLDESTSRSRRPVTPSKLSLHVTDGPVAQQHRILLRRIARIAVHG